MEKNIHEDCGVAMLRLLKPLSYFKEKYECLSKVNAGCKC